VLTLELFAAGNTALVRINSLSNALGCEILVSSRLPPLAPCWVKQLMRYFILST
jgi:hypothetical protein